MNEMQSSQSVQSEYGSRAASSWVTVTEPAELTAIYREGINVCHFPRQLDPSAARFASEVLAAQDFEKVLTVSTADIKLAGLLPAESADAAVFLADVHELIEMYAELLGASTLGVRLCSLHQAMCPRFHFDRVLVRLVCTYQGPGTQWLDAHDVDRSKLGAGAGGLADEASGLIRRAGAVQSASLHAVCLLKGSAWPGNEQSPAIHRSPPLLQTEPRRVLVTIETLP